jgi:hypothetical protein
MIKLQMFGAWFAAFSLGIAVLIALTVADFFVTLFELPFDTWELVKEKFEEIE